MEGAPHGTVTFLFTDVEGSTGLWEEFPDAMQAALAAHDATVRSVIGEHGGYVFSTAGDAFSAAFWTPGDALAAAVEAQRRLAGVPSAGVELRVRMGLHTGTAEERDGDYFGPAVNRAARIMAAAHGGQIVMSLGTGDLVRDRLPRGAALFDLGEHALPGLSRAERVFQLSAPGLTAQFPPLRTNAPLVGNLPPGGTSFVGRDEELRRLVAELAGCRLVTLTGVGGVGKTRLALEAGRQAGQHFPDGVWLCELAPLADPEAVAHAVATTLSIRLQEGLSMVDSVSDALRSRRALVILDNCEHLLDATADLAGCITASCPTVTLLATSREPIGVPVERVWAVPSFRSHPEGVALFCDRAAAADAGFSPTERDIELIGRICERLDGIPLAIELAAARVRSMTLADVDDRLSDRFRLLRGGHRGGVERHQTLRATVQWSHQLLTGDERLLFDRLSVFAGSFDVPAAEAVCSDDRLDRRDIADLTVSLVDKSMVVADRAGPRARYRLLETLRQYGEERLEDEVQLAGLRDRHLEHFVDVAGRAHRQLVGTDAMAGLGRLESEWDNFRAAVQWAVTRADAPRATALVETLHRFALVQLRSELGEWAERILELADAGSGAYAVAADFALLRGNHPQALRLVDMGFAPETPTTPRGRRLCAEASGRALWFSGQVAEAWAAVQTEERMCDPVEEPFDAAWAALRAATFAVVVDPPAVAICTARARALAVPLHNAVLDTHLPGSPASQNGPSATSTQRSPPSGGRSSWPPGSPALTSKVSPRCRSASREGPGSGPNNGCHRDHDASSAGFSRDRAAVAPLA